MSIKKKTIDRNNYYAHRGRTWTSSSAEKFSGARYCEGVFPPHNTTPLTAQRNNSRASHGRRTEVIGFSLKSTETPLFLCAWKHQHAPQLRFLPWSFSKFLNPTEQSHGGYPVLCCDFSRFTAPTLVHPWCGWHGMPAPYFLRCNSLTDTDFWGSHETRERKKHDAYL